MNPHTSSDSAFQSATPLPKDNNGGFVSGIHVGQVPSQPVFAPQPNTTAQINGPYAFQHNGGASTGPTQVNAASSGNSFQAQPFSVVNIGNSTYNQSFINPHLQHSAAAIPLPYSLVHPQQYFAAFPRVTQPPFYGVPSQAHFPAQNTYFQQYHGAGPVSTSSIPSPATAPSTGRRRGAGGRQAREEEERVRQFADISEDPDFQRMGERDERGNEKFECLRTGCKRIIIGSSYVKHLETASHRGVTKGMYVCPKCGKPLSRRDAVKRHRESCEKLLAKQAALLAGLNTSQVSMSSSSVAVPTAPCTLPEPTAINWMPSATPFGNVQMPLPGDAEMRLSNTSMYADPLPPLPEYSEFPETTVAAVPDPVSLLPSLDLQPEALTGLDIMMPNEMPDEGLDELLACLNAILPNATSGMGNVQMPPSADAVSPWSDTSMFTDPLPPFPEASESPETAEEAAAADKDSLFVSGDEIVYPELWDTFDKISKGLPVN